MVAGDFEQDVDEVFPLDHSLHEAVNLPELTLKSRPQIAYLVECTKGFITHVLSHLTRV